MTSVPTSGAATAPHRARAGVVGILALSVFGAALIGAWRGNEFAQTWFYDAAWWSYIFFVDALVYRRRGSSILFSHSRAFALLAVWSAAFWLFFEVLNFRLQNWYYVGLPRDDLSRSIGIFVSFATVLPGIFETADLLASCGAFAERRCQPWKIPRRARAWLFACGTAFLVLPLCLPRYTFPLTWGATLLLCEAWLLGRGSGGLLSELARGRSGTVGRWLAAGLVCGLLWETWNSLAQARWIYTVPFFEDSKLFEMPYAGFLGFPPFALECYSFARVLVALRLVPDWEMAPADHDRHAMVPAREWLGAIAAWEQAGIRTTEELLRAAGERDAARLFAGTDAVRQAETLETARLMQVRGLGARGIRALSEAGVTTIDALARSDPDRLFLRLRANPIPSSPPLTAAEVRVWVRGARLEH